MTPLDDLGGQPEILDATVGARSQEDGVNGDVAHLGTWCEVHVLQGASSGATSHLILEILGGRDDPAQRDPLAGVRPPRHEGGELGCVEADLGVKGGVVVSTQGAPILDGLVPLLALGCMRTVLEVGEGGLVGGDHAGAGSPLDRHVADRHAALHRHLLDGLTAILDHVALATAGAGLGDEGQDEVLRGDAFRQLPVNRHRHGPGLDLRQGLGRQHVLDLAGADAKGQSTQGTMGRGVGVTTHNRHTRLGEPQLGANDVYHSLVRVTQRMQRHPELRSVLTQRLDLCPRDRVGDGLENVEGGDVVVLGRNRQIRATNLASRQPQSVEGLGTGHLVHKVEVDVEKVALPVLSMPDNVGVPELLAQRSPHRVFPFAGRSSPMLCGMSSAPTGWRDPF